MKKMSELIEQDHRDYENNIERRQSIEEVAQSHMEYFDELDILPMFSNDGKTVGSSLGKCKSGNQFRKLRML